MRKGFTVRTDLGLGDIVQFTSLPENYFRQTGEKLIDVTRHTLFDFNPYVDRESTPDEVTELWANHKPFKRSWSYLSPETSAPAVYLSNAEHHVALFGLKNTPLVRPRLYRYEDFPIAKRQTVLLHTNGRSHGQMPDNCIEHVKQKYGHMEIYRVGLPGEPCFGLPKIETPTLWDLVKVISECRIFIGVDSGPSWVAACYPDVVLKKLRLRPRAKFMDNWVPLEMANINSHWDDRAFQIYNTSEDDIGFSQSFRRI